MTDASLVIPSEELARLAARHPHLALEVLGHPGLSLRGLEAILANLLPFGPRPDHALAAASNPALPLLFLTEPHALVPIWGLLLHLGQGALVGALHVARQLPWSARHQLDAFSGFLPHGSRPGDVTELPSVAAALSPLEARVPRLFRCDIRFRTAHAVLTHVERSETLEGLYLGLSLFRHMAPFGVVPPTLWQCIARTL